jgi:hypothetical protein
MTTMTESPEVSEKLLAASESERNFGDSFDYATASMNPSERTSMYLFEGDEPINRVDPTGLIANPPESHVHPVINDPTIGLAHFEEGSGGLATFGPDALSTIEGTPSYQAFVQDIESKGVNKALAAFDPDVGYSQVTFDDAASINTINTGYMFNLLGHHVDASATATATAKKIGPPANGFCPVLVTVDAQISLDKYYTFKNKGEYGYGWLQPTGTPYHIHTATPIPLHYTTVTMVADSDLLPPTSRAAQSADVGLSPSDSCCPKSEAIEGDILKHFADTAHPNDDVV